MVGITNKIQKVQAPFVPAGAAAGAADEGCRAYEHGFGVNG
jgi:hypothetical protein